MARKFDIPAHYQGGIVSTVKKLRNLRDPRKRDTTPTALDFGPVVFHIARNFGFCFGVENAIEIAYKTLNAHPDRKQYMLSEMIHNPHVNDDLRSRGMEFLRTTDGEQLIPFDVLDKDDIVLIPAFGTTVAIKKALAAKGLDVKTYDTTCPFVTKVWTRSRQLGRKGYSVVIHGKHYHEESRATVSHARQWAPVVVVRDAGEARMLARVITGEEPAAFFYERFKGRHSEGFDPVKDLVRFGVVNQTTMLVTETQAIAALLRQALIRRYGSDAIADHFADTRDTLCYATHENQVATRALLELPPDLTLVVGGYNSSNTSQLVTICEEVAPTYFIKGAEEITSADRIQHFDYPSGQLRATTTWLPATRPLHIALTAGASCPDREMDRVIMRILDLMPAARSSDEVLAEFNGVLPA